MIFPSYSDPVTVLLETPLADKRVWSSNRQAPPVRVDKRLTKFLECIRGFFLSCRLAGVEFISVLRAAVPAGPGRSEVAVKRDVPQFRPLVSWSVTVLSIFVTLLLMTSVPAMAQEPSSSDESLAATGDGK